MISVGAARAEGWSRQRDTAASKTAAWGVSGCEKLESEKPLPRDAQEGAGADGGARRGGAESPRTGAAAGQSAHSSAAWTGQDRMIGRLLRLGCGGGVGGAKAQEAPAAGGGEGMSLQLGQVCVQYSLLFYVNICPCM